MRIAVVSDTHGHVANTLAAIQRIDEENIDLVLHCGDVGSAGILPLFGDWPFHFVLGNVDHDGASLRRAASEFGQVCHDRFGDLELAGTRVAMLHGDDQRKLRETVDSQAYALVCCGHTHVMEHRREGVTTILNPGALYRAKPHSLAIVELPAIRIRFIELES